MATKVNNPNQQAGGTVCPDPSAHTKNTTLQDQASTAALYATGTGKGSNTRILDDDNKLSSAGAAASLKYARAQDLPAFPIVGIDRTASAGTAANLANSNQKNITRWKPEPSDSASKAALLAADYKMAPQWHPEASVAGSKAALLAHRDGGKLNLWSPTASKDGNSAAGQAMRKKEPVSTSAQEHADEIRKKALMAATGAVSSRKRAGSTPLPVSTYPDSANSAHNALNAASVAHRPSTVSRPHKEAVAKPSQSAMEAARVKHIGQNVPREMYTEHPPVALEVEEKNHQAALRASAISMAKQMYPLTQTHDHAASGAISAAAAKAHQAEPLSPEQKLRQQAMRYVNIQEAAQKLAAERLAKLKTNDGSDFQNYYGYSKEPRRNRLSIRNRRRASSEGAAADSDDDERSKKIKSQMSLFSDRIAEVDTRKRQKDREALMAAAEKRVQARLHDMDEKVFMETGKVSPAMMEEWEARAQAKAAAESELRMANHGKVHVGGGKFLDQSEIDAVAAARVQPTLDEINKSAEKQRARDEEIRLDQEEHKRQAHTEKLRQAELKADQKRAKEDEKQASRVRKAEEKKVARTEKEAEKARKAEEKRIHRENRKSKEVEDKPRKPLNPVEAAVASGAVHESKSNDDDEEELARIDTSSSSSTETGAQLSSSHANAEAIASRVVSAPIIAPAGNTATPSAPGTTLTIPSTEPRSPTSADETTEVTPPTSPTKSESKVRSLINRLRRKSKPPTPDPEPSFVGGATLTGASVHSPSPAAPNATTATKPDGEAIATSSNTAAPVLSRSKSPSISSLSSASASASASASRGRQPSRRESDVSALGEGEFEEARDTFDEGLAPPPSFATEGKIRATSSPVRDSKFQENL